MAKYNTLDPFMCLLNSIQRQLSTSDCRNLMHLAQFDEVETQKVGLDEGKNDIFIALKIMVRKNKISHTDLNFLEECLSAIERRDLIELITKYRSGEYYKNLKIGVNNKKSTSFRNNLYDNLDSREASGSCEDSLQSVSLNLNGGTNQEETYLDYFLNSSSRVSNSSETSPHVSNDEALAVPLSVLNLNESIELDGINPSTSYRKFAAQDDNELLSTTKNSMQSNFQTSRPSKSNGSSASSFLRTVEIDKEKTDLTDIEIQIIKCLEDCNTPVKAHVIMNRLNMKKKSDVNAPLYRLQKKKLVEKTSEQCPMWSLKK